jgi:hypothetical protein
MTELNNHCKYMDTTGISSLSILFSKMKEYGLGCSSVVQRLPSMNEALVSIPAPKKKRQKKTSPLKNERIIW